MTIPRPPSHDAPAADGLSFLAGGGDMTRMIRERDWTDHPFGALETWPQSLRSALSICLPSAFPTAIYWGRELRLLYNDAWAPIPGPRHPAAVGAPAREVWADIWHVIEPQFAHLLSTGEGVFVADQMLPMRRYGAPEETYWSYSFTPIRGEDGAIAGIFNSGHETTATVLTQRRTAFLLDLDEALRAGGGLEDVRRRSLEMLGEHLCADRVGIATPTEDDDVVDIVEQWTAPDVEPVGRRVTLTRFGDCVRDALRAGRAVTIDDAARDPRIRDDRTRASFASRGVAAAAAIPVMADGALVSMAFLHARAPRAWNRFEIGVVEDVLERTQTWIERERAAERERIMLREVDHRARNVLAIALSVVRMTRADDIETYREKVGSRVAALARAHALLASEGWSSVELSALIKEELAPHADKDLGRVRIDGPAVPLPPEHAQSIALVLHELTTNAAKHGGLAAPEGALSIAWRVEDAGTLCVSWTETLPEPPKQALRGGRGGFGANLLAQVVEALGGDIAWQLTDAGLECRIRLPLHAPKGDCASAAEDRRAPDGRDRRRVLIVEDEALIAMQLEAIIRDLGHEVFAVCSSVADGLAALERGQPDLAILDANLRGESSLPIAERLHDRGVPVIFATGYASMASLPEPLASAPTLTKPVSEQVLADAIATALDRA